MKKTILLFVTTLLVSFCLYAQEGTVLIQESFDDGVIYPEGWERSDVANFGWELSSTSLAGGEPAELRHTFAANINEFGFTDRFISPEIDLTGYGSLLLEFKYEARSFDPCTFGIATTSDNGATWNICWEQDFEAITGPPEAPLFSQILETPDIGSSTFRFCFYIIYNEGQWMSNFSIDDVVLVGYEGPVAISEPAVAKKNNISVYPNPARDMVKIASDKPINHLQVFDLSGKLMYEVKGVNQNNHQFNVSGFARGVYLLKVDGAGYKIIKQ